MNALVHFIFLVHSDTSKSADVLHLGLLAQFSKYNFVLSSVAGFFLHALFMNTIALKIFVSQKHGREPETRNIKGATRDELIERPGIA